MRTIYWMRVWRGGLVAALAIAAALPGRAQGLATILEVNGRRVPLRGTHRIYQDRGVWMVPVRPVLDAARISYTWDSRQQELEVWARYDRLVVRDGSYTVLKPGGRREVLSRPVVVRMGEPYAPADFIEMCLDTRAVYDRRSDTLSFETSGWMPRRPWNERRDGWWYDRDRRDYDRLPGGRYHGYRKLTVECPSYSYTRSVRIEGDWGGTTVRVRIVRRDGREAINRTAVTRDGRWSMEVYIGPGSYRVIAEGIYQGSTRETAERTLEVR